MAFTHFKLISSIQLQVTLKTKHSINTTKQQTTQKKNENKTFQSSPFISKLSVREVSDLPWPTTLGTRTLPTCFHAG